ncbi:hypothetical protein AVEN_188552-1 [Araneus ventricosus]|uniref:Uncharacterized protein n=1 Tax=Araneus ventricosus TaxID=182803 RepID=A0A4Y2RHA1_ARAVE|nr:hypothetical protein AVEN_242262-1 [Araneus ventricosus]GBN75083.1 hypothetical protein AVEN_188552-1 [Araneus ventricosus]
MNNEHPTLWRFDYAWGGSSKSRLLQGSSTLDAIYGDEWSEEDIRTLESSAASMASGKKREELKKKTEKSIRIGLSSLHLYATQMAFRLVSFATKSSYTIRSQIWRDTSLKTYPACW